LSFQALTRVARRPARASDGPVVTTVVTVGRFSVAVLEQRPPVRASWGLAHDVGRPPGAGRVRVRRPHPTGDSAPPSLEAAVRRSVQDVRLGLWTMRAGGDPGLDEGSQLSLSTGAGERPSPPTARGSFRRRDRRRSPVPQCAS
jgi:hypothetical protein